MRIHAHGLVVRERRISLVTGSPPKSVLFASLAQLAAKTLAERCPELVGG